MHAGDGPSDDAAGARPLSPCERLAEQFYEWEARGRGWLLWDDPVRPEPPYTPFFGYRQCDGEAKDDGRTNTWLSGFTQWVSRLLMGKGREAEAPENEEREEKSSVVLPEAGPLTEFQITLPATSKSDIADAEQMLISVGACRHPLSFEVIGLPEETVVQLVCGVKDAAHVRAQLQAHFAEASFKENDQLLATRWDELPDAESVVIEFGLSREFVLPLVSGKQLPQDLLLGMAATMEQVEEGELALLQVMFEPVRHPWAQSVLRAVATTEGDNLFGGTIDMLAQAKAKIARPLYAAVVRIACRCRTRGRAWELARRLGRAFEGLADPLGNELIPLDNDEYDEEVHAQDVPLRRCRRSGMIVSSTELASLVHPPTAVVRTPKLKRRVERSKVAPALVQGHSLVLGSNEHGGKKRPVTLSADQRVRHMHVIGASGTGKSTFLQNLIVQDIQAGEGVAVLDPHGDLVDSIIERIPPDRASDVVLFDPSDEQYPVGFNILAAHSDTEKTLLASDLVSVFRRLSTSWGDQMTAVLGNAVLAFLESDCGGTLADLRRFLVEPPFRERFLRSVQDAQVVYYWRKEFPLLVGRPQGPVLTRLDTFLRPKAIRHVVAQQANRLDFAEIMDGGRIFLARLAQGAVGEENAYLLGALLVSKFHQLALGRQQVKESDRKPFWLYVDEFQHFATPSMASLLSGVRKYRLGLVLAHQELHQLESRSPEVASAVVSNAYTRVCFRVGDQDARKLESGFSSFEAADLQNLGTGEAVCRVEQAEFDFNLRTSQMPVVSADEAARTRERVVALSREKYAIARALVEAQLRETTEAAAAEPSPSAKGKPATPPAAIESPPIPAPSITLSPSPRPSAEPQRDTESSLPASEEEAKKPKRRRVPAEEAVLGRGGPQHKYLQQLIKRWAEGLGYRATIEGSILGGKKIADVALEKPDRSIACLVSVTTSDEWEFASVRECLATKVQLVAMVSGDERHLAKLREGIETALSTEERQRVQFFLPEQLFAYVQELELKALQQEKTVRGYKVKTSYRALDAGESDERRTAISQVVAKSIKRVGARRR